MDKRWFNCTNGYWPRKIHRATAEAAAQRYVELLDDEDDDPSMMRRVEVYDDSGYVGAFEVWRIVTFDVRRPSHQQPIHAAPIPTAIPDRG